MAPTSENPKASKMEPTPYHPMEPTPYHPWSACGLQNAKRTQSTSPTAVPDEEDGSHGPARGDEDEAIGFDPEWEYKALETAKEEETKESSLTWAATESPGGPPRSVTESDEEPDEGGGGRCRRPQGLKSRIIKIQITHHWKTQDRPCRGRNDEP